MLNSPSRPPASEPTPDEINAVVRSAPKGTITVAGIATLVVLAMWIAFYFFVFLARGVPA
jgi:hypothetical protein